MATAHAQSSRALRRASPSPFVPHSPPNRILRRPRPKSGRLLRKFSHSSVARAIVRSGDVLKARPGFAPGWTAMQTVAFLLGHCASPLKDKRDAAERQPVARRLSLLVNSRPAARSNSRRGSSAVRTICRPHKGSRAMRSRRSCKRGANGVGSAVRHSYRATRCGAVLSAERRKGGEAHAEAQQA
jgi:hypothetical protein